MQTQLRHRGRTVALVALALLVALVTAIGVAGGAGASSPASTSGGSGRSGEPAWLPVQSEGQEGQRERAPEGDRDCPEGERGGQGSGARQDQGSQGTAATPEV